MLFIQPHLPQQSIGPHVVGRVQRVQRVVGHRLRHGIRFRFLGALGALGALGIGWSCWLSFLGLLQPEGKNTSGKQHGRKPLVSLVSGNVCENVNNYEQLVETQPLKFIKLFDQLLQGAQRWRTLPWRCVFHIDHGASHCSLCSDVFFALSLRSLVVRRTGVQPQ